MANKPEQALRKKPAAARAQDAQDELLFLSRDFGLLGARCISLAASVPRARPIDVPFAHKAPFSAIASAVAAVRHDARALMLRAGGLAEWIGNATAR